MEEIKYVKSVIERDIKAEFEAMLDRLRNAEGGKLAVLAHDIAELQREIDRINDVVHTVNDLTTPGQDPVKLLLRIRSLTENIENISAR